MHVVKNKKLPSKCWSKYTTDKALISKKSYSEVRIFSKNISNQGKYSFLMFGVRIFSKLFSNLGKKIYRLGKSCSSGASFTMLT
jgi:hypothetical protein